MFTSLLGWENQTSISNQKYLAIKEEKEKPGCQVDEKFLSQYKTSGYH